MSAPSGSRDSSMGMNVVTTAMAFSVSAFFALFIFARLLCARIHLRAAAAEHSAAAARAAHAGDVASLAIHMEQAGQVERGIRGMEPSVVATFPTAKLGDDPHPPPVQEESLCTVCLEEYEAKDVVRVLPYCGHAFHVACIDAWLKLHSTCPICRASMRATAKHRAAATEPPVYYAVDTARQPIQLPTSSSERNALQAEPAAAAAAGTDHMDMDVMASRLEISSDEPATSGAACPSAAPARGAGDYPCSGTARQSPQGNASEHC